MDNSNNKPSDEKGQVNSVSRLTFCQRKKSGNGSFVSNLRNHFHEFLHASADEHKTCLRNTIQKILNASKVFGKNGDSTNKDCGGMLGSNCKDFSPHTSSFRLNSQTVKTRSCGNAYLSFLSVLI